MAKKYNENQTAVADTPYPEMKSETYQLMGGINSKVSLYTNGPTQFRDISNLNFVYTNALSKRPGTTLFGGITLPATSGFPAITTGYEFQKLNGASYLVVTANGALNQMHATFVLTPTAFNGYGSVPVKAGALFSFTTFVDRLFGCEGTDFYRLSPITGISTVLNSFLYSIPDGSSQSSIGVTGLASGFPPGLSGTFVYGFSYINDRGFIGPPCAGITVSLNGSQAVQFTLGYMASFLLPYYGVTAIQLYRSEVDGVVLTETSVFPVSFTGATSTFFDVGSTLTNVAAIASNDFYMPNLGGTFIFSQGLGVTPQPPFIPRFLETFNNQLFMAGFSTAPSTFWWSEIGEPEGVQAEFSDEVRTNDGDVISGMKSYFGSLIISKRKSLHILTGTDPNNFTLQELTDQYGCVSHRSMVPWNNVLWFLDSKGIMEFNGANIQCVSTPIEPIFKNMNIGAAYDNACGIHVKRFNELWWSIPANGSTINNQIVVYDYVANAWTHYDGIQAQCLFNAFAGFPNLTPFAGGYTGGTVYFDPTLTSDNDQGITCSFDSIFFALRGQTTQNLYRRFYLNVDPVLGFTQPITVNFKTDFGATVQLTQTMYQSPFQSRVDFGLSSRSIQASVYHYSASLPLKINGFTFESRYLRDV